MEKADLTETPDGEWVWKPFNLHEVFGINNKTTCVDRAL